MRDIQVSAKDTKVEKYSLDNGFKLTQRETHPGVFSYNRSL